MPALRRHAPAHPREGAGFIGRNARNARNFAGIGELTAFKAIPCYDFAMTGQPDNALNHFDLAKLPKPAPAATPKAESQRLPLLVDPSAKPELCSSARAERIVNDMVSTDAAKRAALKQCRQSPHGNLVDDPNIQVHGGSRLRIQVPLGDLPPR